MRVKPFSNFDEDRLNGSGPKETNIYIDQWDLLLLFTRLALVPAPGRHILSKF